MATQSVRLDGVLVTQYGTEMTVEMFTPQSIVVRRSDGYVVVFKADGTKVVTDSDSFVVTVQ